MFPVREGVPANFFVYYEIDEEEAKHSLELVEHGHQEVPHACIAWQPRVEVRPAHAQTFC